MGYLDNTGLNYLWSKIKVALAASLSVSGRTVTLKSKSGAILSTITTQDTTYNVATTAANGLMSSTDKTKLNGVAAGATSNTVTQRTLSLTTSGWSNKAKTLAAPGVTSTNIVLVDIGSNTSGIKCTSQGTNTLTFTYETAPTSSISVNYFAIS